MGEVVANPEAVNDLKNQFWNAWYTVHTTTTSIAGNTDGSVTIDMPSGVTHDKVAYVIPLGYIPSSTWETRFMVKNVSHDANGWRVNYRTQGSTAQTYTVYCVCFVGIW